MKRLISVLLIALILLAGCKKAEDDVVNQNLVNDGVETSPVVSRPQTENQPEKDPAPAPAPKPETKPETKPEVKPETKPEPQKELEFFARDFFFSKYSVSGIAVPENRVITSLEQLDKYDKEFEEFYSSNNNWGDNCSFKNKLEFKHEDGSGYFSEQLFENKDILVLFYNPTRAFCEYEITKVYSNGQVNIDITEYWKDSDLYGYNYIVFIVEVPKGSVDKITSVKTTTKKASNDTYIDFESKKVTIGYPEIDSKPFPDFEVIGSVEQLNAHMNKYSALFKNGYFYGSDVSKYTDEYFNKNVIALKTFIGSSYTYYGVQAITDQGEIIYYCRSGSAIATDIIGYVVIAEVDRSLLKGELHINKETYMVDEHMDGSLK